MRKIILQLLMLLVMTYLEPAAAQARQNEQLHLNSRNTVVLRGEVTEASIIKTETELVALVATRALTKDYPLYLVIDSPGGDVNAGLSFIQFAKIIKNLHTVTIFSASMAAGIVEGLPGRRLITDDGQLMFHRAAGGVEGQIETGELESRLASIKKMVLRMENMNASRLQITLADYKAKILNEYWLDSEDAIHDKAADKIIDIVCSQELAERTESVTVESMFGVYVAKYSKCPRMRGPM